MLIAAAKERVAVSVNAELTMLYWSAGKNEEHVELLELGRSNIRVASYMTELPPKKVLEAKFRLAIEAARNRIAAKEVCAMIDSTINDDKAIADSGEDMKWYMDRHIACGVGASRRCYDK